LSLSLSHIPYHTISYHITQCHALYYHPQLLGGYHKPQLVASSQLPARLASPHSPTVDSSLAGQQLSQLDHFSKAQLHAPRSLAPFVSATPGFHPRLFARLQRSRKIREPEMTENHLRLPFRHGLWRYVDNGSLCNFFAFAFLFCNVYAGSHGSCLSLPWESVGCSGRYFT
jgi:hypothetical protein